MKLSRNKTSPSIQSLVYWKMMVLVKYRIWGKRRIALASFPRSGNTWVRNLIEKASNLKTGTSTMDGIMPGKSEGVVVKTHFWDSHKYTGAIHVLRNPFDSFHSYYLWKKSYLNFEGSLDESLAEDIEGWKNHSLHWLNSSCPTMLIRYEDLHADTPSNLKNILEWLKLDTSDDLIQNACVKSQISNLKKENPGHSKNHYREGRVGAGKEAFTSDQQKLILDQLGFLLEKFNYT